MDVFFLISYLFSLVLVCSLCHCECNRGLISGGKNNISFSKLVFTVAALELLPRSVFEPLQVCNNTENRLVIRGSQEVHIMEAFFFLYSPIPAFLSEQAELYPCIKSALSVSPCPHRFVYWVAMTSVW